MQDNDFRNLVNKLRLMEAEDDHRPDTHNPKVDYEYKGKTNKATENEQYDRVIARLASGQSATFTKIANQYRKINEALKELNSEKAQLNEQTRKAIESLFPVQDDLLTKIVETNLLLLL